MLRPNNMQLLQAKRRIIRMPHHDTRRLPLRAINTLIHLQDIANAQMNLWVPAIHMLPAIIADDIHLQPTRLNLTIEAILDRTLDRRRQVIVQLSTLVRSRSKHAISEWRLGALALECLGLISRSPASAPAVGEVEPRRRRRRSSRAIACPATACCIRGEIVRVLKGPA